jgi:multimeric flavodoxin WrbA
MPIKIIGIVSSPHKDGMTFQLVQQALAGAKAADAEIQLSFLADEMMDPCQGCGGDCWETGECVNDHSQTTHLACLQEADGLIIGVPVYFWQMNGLAHLFIDKMRWNTGSVLEPHNQRAAFGISCAGGSGTGCVMALQALYRYFYNWAFHGIAPLPVTRFNFQQALEESFTGGTCIVKTIRDGLQPFQSLGEALADLEKLPYMMDGPIDELRLIVHQLMAGIPKSSDPRVLSLYAEAALAEKAFSEGNRQLAAVHYSKAYYDGNMAWK